MSVVVTGKGEVCAGTCVNGSVVNAVGFVAAPPVGEVDHKVKNRTDFSIFSFVVAVYHFGHCADISLAGSETLETEIVYTEATTEYGREPFATVDRCSGHEAVGNSTVNTVGSNVEACTGFCSDEPVVFHAVKQNAL